MIMRRIIFLRLRFLTKKIKFKGIAELALDSILITVSVLFPTIPKINQKSGCLIKQVSILRIAVGMARMRSE